MHRDLKDGLIAVRRLRLPCLNFFLERDKYCTEFPFFERLAKKE